MQSDESNFREINTERLLAILHELEQDMIHSAHASTTLEPNPSLLARIGEVNAEIERRARDGEGDPALDGIAARMVESDAALLPPIEPAWASTLTPEAIPNLTDRDLRTSFKKVESDIELHRKAYSEPSEIGDPTKIDIKRTAIVNWRSIANQVLESLSGEMLRRSQQPLGPTSGGRRDRPERRRERPETAARRAIVRSSSNLSDEEICRRLDLDAIPLPENWDGVRNWAEAYRSGRYRQRIHVIVWKDQHH